MIYTDERKQEKINAKAGDFIYADGQLRVIWATTENGKSKFKSIYVTGNGSFNGDGTVEDSIEDMINFYKRHYEDFELIKSEEMELVRRA